jgi:hypothetical protein
VNSPRAIFILFLASLRAGAVAAEAGAAWVRHAPVVRGRIDGSVQVMTSEAITLSGNAVITGDLRVPGRPTVKVAGAAGYGALVDLLTQPVTASPVIALEGGAQAQRIVRGATPIALAQVVLVRPVAGSRSVALMRATDSAGDFATVKDLTIGAGAGSRAIPPGAYGDLSLEGKAVVVLGIAGAAAPSFTNLNSCRLPH